MFIKQVFFWSGVLFLFAACGQKRQERASWPAAVISIQEMSGMENQDVQESISKLNQRLGKEALKLGEGATSQFSIHIRQVTPTKSTENRAGLATFDGLSCEVELSTLIFQGQKQMLDAVLWHELGHCAGLDHNPTKGEVMFHSASPTASYSPEAMDRFFKEFARAAGMM